MSKEAKKPHYRKRVLIVDDFPDMRTNIKRMLNGMGIEHIDVAANANKALEAMGNKRYDLVLCDYNLGPGKNGQQTLEEARHKDLIGLATVFVMVTAENTMGMVLGAVEYKPDAYLAKPLTKALLENRLNRLFERKGSLGLIEKAATARQFETAIKLCDEQLATQPKNTLELQRLKTEFLMALGQFSAAQQLCEEVLEKRKQTWAYIALGKIAYHQKDHAKARRIFESLVDECATCMEAYDWLAMALEELEEDDNAKNVLQNATQLSPQALLRQQCLGDLAHRGGDNDIAQTAYKKAMTLGKLSVYRRPSDYTRYAKIKIEENDSKVALDVLTRAKKQFTDSPAAMMEVQAAQSVIHLKNNDRSSANEIYSKVKERYGEIGAQLSPDAATDIAEAAFINGDKEQGIAIMEHVVNNNHENNHVLRRVQAVFHQLDMEEEGKTLINDSKQAMAQLNNQGVQLAKSGKMIEAIEFFEKAIEVMPASATINLNLSQVILMFINKAGEDSARLAQAKKLIDSSRKLDPTHHGLAKATAMFNRLSTNTSAAS